MTLNIKIINNQVILSLDNREKIEWQDRRDLSEKLLVKIDQLLKSRGVKSCVPTADISKVNFKGENCGFMAEQVGKITAEVLNEFI